MEGQKQRRKTRAWPHEYGGAIRALSFRSIARRILLTGLTVSAVIIVLGHYILLPSIPARFAFFLFATTEIAVETFCKCYCAYRIAKARAGWMTMRCVLVDTSNKLSTNVDDLQIALAPTFVGKPQTWVTEVKGLISSIGDFPRSILSSVQAIDKSMLEAERVIGTGPYLEVSCSNALPRLPKIWELLGRLLPTKTKRSIFDPAFNDMLGDYLKVQKFLGSSGRRWLAFGFTMYAVYILLDCYRVFLSNGVGKFLLTCLPESLRSWVRRQ